MAQHDWAGLQPFLNDHILEERQDGCLWGILAWRSTAPGEREILYLETAPAFRRRGVAKRLLAALVRDWEGTVFLEVRESNHAAIALYQGFGFTVAGKRPEYYYQPAETALVLKYCS